MKKSLEEFHGSVEVKNKFTFFRKLLAFSGPGYLIAVGYMDPGNWATDLAGGSRFGYTLLFVILLSNLFAILLQHLALKLGIATGRDLAQACRDFFPRPINFILWIMAEIMIIACDLAEVIGSAIALNLLFHIPLQIGVIITALDVIVLLALFNRGFRYLEIIVITLIVTILTCFGLEILFAQPNFPSILKGLIPTSEIITNTEMLYIAVGILGATVMPHNLYLHSSIVQTRRYQQTLVAKKEAIKFATIDSTIALSLAFFVNAAILIVAAATFFTNGYNQVAEIEEAYKLLSPLLGVGAASTLFAFALLASGQNSTITATLAGQVIMEGFLNIHIKPWLRRIITRLLAIIPAVAVLTIYGGQGLGKLLILSQVILSIQLSFAVFPLVFFTSNKKIMGSFANPLWIKILAILIAIIIAGLNLWLILNVF
jgi:manganese transport protein